MEKYGKSYYVDKSTDEAIQRIADERFDGKASMALRWIVDEYVYLSERFVALGRRLSEPVETDYEGEGVA